MKKLLSIALCATAVSAFADPAEAVLGQVGVTAITSSLSNTIVAVSYDDLAGGTGMVVSNFVKTTNLTKGDQLAIFNNGTGTEIYDTWVLKKNGSNALYWEKNEKTYMVGTNGQLKVGTGTPASSITNAVGTGIWLVRQKPTENNVALPFYIYGKPVSDPVSHIKAGTWTLVGNPTQKTPVKIGPQSGENVGTNAVVKGAKTGDQIVTVGANGTLQYFVYVEGSGWVGGLPDIDPGIGFWIRTQAATEITWPKE